MFSKFLSALYGRFYSMSCFQSFIVHCMDVSIACRVFKVPYCIVWTFLLHVVFSKFHSALYGRFYCMSCFQSFIVHCMDVSIVCRVFKVP